MADFIGKCRTNYAKFDLAKLKRVLETIEESSNTKFLCHLKYDLNGGQLKQITIDHLNAIGEDEKTWTTKLGELFPTKTVDVTSLSKEAFTHLIGVAFIFEEDYPYIGEDENGEEMDFASMVSECLEDNSILIFTGIGSEANRYLSGWATAYNNKGESTSVNIDSIYNIAAHKFNLAVDEITRAEY